MASCAGVSAENRDRAERQYLVALDLFGKGLDDQALKETVELLVLDPENAEAHNLLGLIFLRRGASALRVAEVEDCFKGRAMQEQRHQADEQMRRAQKEFSRALSLRESFTEAYNNLSVVALHFKEYDRAIELGRRVLSDILYSQAHLAYGNVGWAYYQKGDLVGAARELRQAVFHQPEFCVGHYRLAQVYFDQKNLDEAIRHLERVAAQKCPIQEAYHLAGMIYALKHEKDRAQESLNGCTQLAPRSCRARQCEQDRRLTN